MTDPQPPDPGANPFDCKNRRHKVITTDRICVLCGARGVVDARRLPEPPPELHILQSVLIEIEADADARDAL